MADMGLRREEILIVETEDVNEYHETMSVVGKGNKERILPWASELFIEELKKVLDKRHSGFLAVNPRTRERLMQIREAMKRVARIAGLDRDVNPHLLRHSCLTNYAKKSIYSHALQQFAGYSSIETTNKIYVYIRSEFVGEEMWRIRKGG